VTTGTTSRPELADLVREAGEIRVSDELLPAHDNLNREDEDER
jgi:hypothetical protein